MSILNSNHFGRSKTILTELQELRNPLSSMRQPIRRLKRADMLPYLDGAEALPLQAPTSCNTPDYCLDD